ncbi:MAG: TetR/AcrR family transcriptional regulator [Thermomicrobiales bacterium]
MTPEPLHRTREQHAEETHAAILREAKRLFMEFGYRAVSTRMVAEASRVTQPALYHHFSGKEDLYVAVLLQELGEMGSRLGAIADGDATVLDRLEQVARYLANRTHHNLTLMQHDIRTELGDASAAIVGARFFEQVVGPINRIVEQGIADGLIGAPETVGLAPIQMGLYFLHQVSFVTRPPARTDHARVIERHLSAVTRERLVVELFLRGVGSTPNRD